METRRTCKAKATFVGDAARFWKKALIDVHNTFRDAGKYEEGNKEVLYNLASLGELKATEQKRVEETMRKRGNLLMKNEGKMRK